MAIVGGRVSPEAAREMLQPVADAIRAGNLIEARRLARKALDAGVEHPMALNLRALDYEEAGMFKQALQDLRRAHILAPRDFSILNACGLALARMDRLEEALACYEQALAIEPNFGPGWYNKGWALQGMGEVAKAIEAYGKSVELNPENVQGWANIALLQTRRGDDEEARRCAEKALAVHPDFPPSQLALVNADMGDPVAAERRLKDILAGSLATFDGPMMNYYRGLALGLLGDALDAQDRSAEAFAAYADSNLALRRDAAPRFEVAGQPTVAQATPWMTYWVKTLDPAEWRAPAQSASAAGEVGHIFLTGFPRSGTTLIESVLARHSDVVTLEERNTVNDAAVAFLDDPNDLARLPGAPESRIAPLREAYWARVAKYGADVREKIFVDKHPFNTLRLPVILKMFPHARILFAVRDPRDVVLSCFRRRFNVNATTYEFLDLERTAANYDETMRFADLFRAKVPYAEHLLVYERLVADFDTEVRKVCEFVGLDWRDDLIDFAGRAHRGEVASASGAQIARGLYADGAGQWRRYREQLAPVLPRLAPWVERFGYEPD
ncbi:MAG TPA: sulfotransferase [Caulobacteraceae bacterium]